SYEGLEKFFQDEAETVNSVPVLKESVGEFTVTVEGIRLKSVETKNASTGKTAAKNQAEDELVTALLPVASGVFIYGKKKNDVELKEKAKVTESGLRLMRDTELASRGEDIATLAEGVLSNLAPSNITADSIAALKAKAQAYRTSIGARESGVAGRMGARTSMEELFAKADEILEEEIDPAMELIRATKTQFYNEYFTLRVVKDTGVRHRPEPVPAPAATPAK
ncbi:MAG: hypothetical protein ABR936_14865, partial [Bacteroidota bacterium]